jgi:hypothetical protein
MDDGSISTAELNILRQFLKDNGIKIEEVHAADRADARKMHALIRSHAGKAEASAALAELGALRDELAARGASTSLLAAIDARLKEPRADRP